MKRWESDFEFTDAEVTDALFDYVHKHHPHEYPTHPEEFRLSYYIGCNVWLHWTKAGMKEKSK